MSWRSQSSCDQPVAQRALETQVLERVSAVEAITSNEGT